MSTYSLNKGAVKTATTRVLAFISFIMRKYEVQDVEELVLRTNPASTLLFANTLAENDVSPSSILNILLDLERWSEFVYAETGTSSKYCHIQILPINRSFVRRSL